MNIKYKASIISILSVTVIFFLVIFFYKSDNHSQRLSDSKYNDISNFSDRIVFDNYKEIYGVNDLISFYIINNSDTELFFGEVYYLEMFHKSKWYFVEPDSILQLDHLILYDISPNGGITECTIHLSNKYSKLENGKYRIYKELDDEDNNVYISYIEFWLED